MCGARYLCLRAGPRGEEWDRSPHPCFSPSPAHFHQVCAPRKGPTLRRLTHGPGCRVTFGRQMNDGCRGHSCSATRHGLRHPLNTIDSFQTCLPPQFPSFGPKLPKSSFSGLTTKDPRLGALDDRNGFSRSPRGWESAGKGSAGAVSSAASLLGWWTAAFSSCPYMVPSCVCLCPHLLLKRHHLTGRGSTYMASLYLKH